MITKSYIEKCTKYKKGIDNLLWGIKPLLGFEIEDYFHHPTLMDPEVYKQVKEIKVSEYIYADDPTERYPIGQCVLLPTEKDLMAGAEKQLIDIDDHKLGMGAEALLDRIVESPAFIKRFL